jgi:hypothetical protein
MNLDAAAISTQMRQEQALRLAISGRAVNDFGKSAGASEVVPAATFS